MSEQRPMSDEERAFWDDVRVFSRMVQPPPRQPRWYDHLGWKLLHPWWWFR